MIRKKILFYIVIVISFFLITVIYSSNNSISYKKKISKDMDELIKETEEINIELLDIKEMPEGTSYVIKLTNNSPYLIKYNVIYVTIPIKTKNGYRESYLKIEGTPNKLDIFPKDEITLNAFAPIEIYRNNNLLDNMNPSYRFVAYLNKVSEKTRIIKGGSLKVINSD